MVFNEKTLRGAAEFTALIAGFSVAISFCWHIGVSLFIGFHYLQYLTLSDIFSTAIYSIPLGFFVVIISGLLGMLLGFLEPHPKKRKNRIRKKIFSLIDPVYFYTILLIIIYLAAFGAWPFFSRTNFGIILLVLIFFALNVMQRLANLLSIKKELPLTLNHILGIYLLLAMLWGVTSFGFINTSVKATTNNPSHLIYPAETKNNQILNPETKPIKVSIIFIGERGVFFKNLETQEFMFIQWKDIQIIKGLESSKQKQDKQNAQ